MAEEAKRKLRLTLSHWIFISMGLGVIAGLVFGEYCAKISIVGDLSIRLLQMTVIPYVMVSLIAGIGRLSFQEAKIVAIKAGIFLGLSWVAIFTVILIMPLAFPSINAQTFFSPSSIAIKEAVNFLDLYVPSNPFNSMANDIVPAVVFFSICVGIALIGIKDKEQLITNLHVLSSAFSKVTVFFTKVLPFGIFAITAHMAGTMTGDEFVRLQVYFVTYISGSLILTFWVFPGLLSLLTPFSSSEIVEVSKDAFLTAFVTGNMFIILPVLNENCKVLYARHGIDVERGDHFSDVLLPILFSFPKAGKLMILLFIPFAAWFTGSELALTDLPSFVFSGCLSFFASTNVAIPFLLDKFEIPSDMFQMYLATGVINARFSTLLGAMHLLTLTLVIVCSIMGFLRIQWKKLLIYTPITVILILAVVKLSNVVLSHTVKGGPAIDKAIVNMDLLHHPLSEDSEQALQNGSSRLVTSVATSVSKIADITPFINTSRSRLDAIKQRGSIRVGCSATRLPFSYANEEGKLIGLDVDLAHVLAADLGVELELVVLQGLDQVIEEYKKGSFDIFMAGVPITPYLLQDVTFSQSYLDVTLAFIVRDNLRDEFAKNSEIKLMKGLRIGVPYDSYFLKRVDVAYPDAEVIKVNDVQEVFDHNPDNIDALLLTAEGGSVWTILYPQYQVVIPKPNIVQQPIGIIVTDGDKELLSYLDHWILLKIKSGTIKELYNYWILGHGATKHEPRWSVIRNIFKIGT